MVGGFRALNYSQVRFGAPGINTAYACGTFGIARLSTVTNVWTIIDNGVPSGASCTAIGIDKLTSGTIYADTTAGVYKSTDGGNNWSLLMPDSGLYVSILVDPTNSKNVLLSAGVGSSALSLRSADGGLTWSQMFEEGIMAVHPTSPNIMYAVAQSSIFASSDSGITWAGIASPVNFLEDLAILPSGDVVISTDGNSVIEFSPQ
jgi:photosystem II stability/assembly factor-like uncharacterized protein